LGSGKAERLEQGFGAAGQCVGGAHQGDEDLGLEWSLGIAFWFGGSFHETTIFVITTIVKRKVVEGEFSPCPVDEGLRPREMQRL
jgi:hypothetical protein